MGQKWNPKDSCLCVVESEECLYSHKPYLQSLAFLRHHTNTFFFFFFFASS